MTASVFPRLEAGDRLVRLPEVMHLTGFGRSTIYRKVGQGQFPPFLKIGARITAWPLSVINQWLDGVKRGGLI